MEKLMSAEEVLAGWKSTPGVYQQVTTWNDAAERWENLPIPSWENDPFLKVLDSEVDFHPDMTVLDIGCGSGIYSFALAKRVGAIVGVDISPNMIGAAARRADAEGIGNVSFVTGDFSEVDLGGPFDLVFAHMTPAIRDGQTFKRMLDLAEEYCYMAKPCRRTDPVLQEVQSILGIESENAEGRDESILRAFVAVWQRGMTPSMHHRHEQWENSRTLEQALSFYRDQQLAQNPDDGAFDEVTRYLESIAENGTVRETIDTEIVIMGWHMRP